MTIYKNFTENQENEIDEILGNKYKNFFTSIILAPELVTDEKYKTFGKFNTKDKTLKLNPKVFFANDFEDKQLNKKLSMLRYVVLHEIAHDVWKNLTEDTKEEWMSISEWELNPAIRQGKKNLVIPQNDNKKIISNWYYGDEAEKSFPRWYSRKTPSEDFCDSWVFIKNGLISRFEGTAGRKKISFIDQL